MLQRNRGLVVPALFVFCLGLSLSLSADSPCLAQPQSDEAVEMVSLPLDENNSVSLVSFLRFASETLGYPILYRGNDIQERVLLFSGEVQVPRKDFQGYFERLLLNEEILYLENGEGANTDHRIVNLQRAGQSQNIVSKLVVREDLHLYADRGVLITTYLPLENVTARDAITALNALLSQGHMSVESVRAMETANTMVITCVAFKACQIVKLLEHIDRVATDDERGFARNWKALRGDLIELNKRIVELENRLRILEHK